VCIRVKRRRCLSDIIPIVESNPSEYSARVDLNSMCRFVWYDARAYKLHRCLYLLSDRSELPCNEHSPDENCREQGWLDKRLVDKD
jgi:hypothetical protein